MARSTPPGRGKTRLVLAVAGGVLCVDLLTKWWIRSRFRLGESVGLVGDWLRLTYVLNPGAAFGIHVGPYSRPFFAALAVVALAVLVAIVRWTPSGDRARLAALALIMGGALGNLLDRLGPSGGVVDFLDMGVGALRWPVFNLADVGVTAGAILLVLLLGVDEKRDAALSTVPSSGGSGRPSVGRS